MRVRESQSVAYLKRSKCLFSALRDEVSSLVAQIIRQIFVLGALTPTYYVTLAMFYSKGAAGLTTKFQPTNGLHFHCSNFHFYLPVVCLAYTHSRHCGSTV